MENMQIMEKHRSDTNWNELTTVLSVETWDDATIQEIIRNHLSDKSTEYDYLVRSFQERGDKPCPATGGTSGDLKKDDPLLSILSKLQMLSSSFTDEHASLVNAVFRCEWFDGAGESFEIFLKFVASLLTSQPIFVDACLRSLIRRFRSVPFETKPNLDTNTFKSMDDKIRVYFERIHAVLSRALHIVPLSATKLLKFIAEGFPYKLRPEEEHFLYIYNVLLLHRRHPASRSAIFTLLVEYIVKIDAEASPQELNEIDVEDDSDNEEVGEEAAKPPSWKMEHPTAERLDLVLTLLFEYIEHFAAQNEDGSTLLRHFYQESMPAFEGVIFKSHGLTHVQFIWFYMAGLSEKIADDFLRRLCQKTLSPNVPVIFRQYSMCYVSSYLARAKFIPVRVAIKFIDQMVHWIHDYVTEYDGLSNMVDREKIHRVFYAVCQNIFYLLTFRHREILSQRKGLLWFKTLNFERIIMCKLNPLKFCQKIVVELFAAVTREYNLLFCYTVIERNNRLAIFSGPKDDLGELREANPLNTFFPFEPYVLRRSKRFVVSNYRTYDEPVMDSRNDAAAYQGLIADSEESQDSDVVEEELKATTFSRKSRKRQLSENNS